MSVPLPRGRLLAPVALAAGALSLVAACGSSGGSGASHPAAATPAPKAAPATAPPAVTRFFDQSAQFTFVHDGKRTTDVGGPPKAGDRLELGGRLFVGDHTKHGATYVGTEHTICTFDAKMNTQCDGQAAFGNSMIFWTTTGGDPDLVATITGGSGRYQGATGTIHAHTVPGSTNPNDNADVTVSVALKG